MQNWVHISWCMKNSYAGQYDEAKVLCIILLHTTSTTKTFAINENKFYFILCCTMSFFSSMLIHINLNALMRCINSFFFSCLFQHASECRKKIIIVILYQRRVKFMLNMWTSRKNLRILNSDIFYLTSNKQNLGLKNTATYVVQVRIKVLVIFRHFIKLWIITFCGFICCKT